MICILGKSGSGKSVIELALMNNGMKKIVSYTTRPARPGEVHGLDYFFVTEKEFLDMKENNLFAETSFHFMYYYGVAKEDCTNDKLVVINPSGLRQIKKDNNINVYAVYVDCDDRKRMKKLVDRGDDLYEIIRRFPVDEGMFNGIEYEVNKVIYNDYSDAIFTEAVALAKHVGLSN